MIKGNSEIIIQPRDKDLRHTLHVTICTSETSNDGMIKYGLTLSSVTIVTLTEGGLTDNELVSDVVLDEQDISFSLSYPTINGAGKYSLRFVVVLSSGSIKEIDFHKIRCADL